MPMNLKATLLASAMAVAVPGPILAVIAPGEAVMSATRGDQSTEHSGSIHVNGRVTTQGYVMAQAGASRPEAIDYSVRDAQRMLNQLGYNAGPEDGMVGPRTRSGIRAYQRDKAMEANGRLTQDLFGNLSADSGRGGATDRLRDLRESLPEESGRGIDRAIEGGSPRHDRARDALGGRPGNASPSMGRGSDMDRGSGGGRRWWGSSGGLGKSSGGGGR